LLGSKEVKELKKKILEQWGCSCDMDFCFFKNRDNKLFIANRDILKLDLSHLNVNSIGLYFARISHGELKLSIEGSQLIGPKATKNIVELDDEQFWEWIRGLDVAFHGESKSFVIVKHNSDFYGCARHKEGKLMNMVPKERRIRRL